MSSRWKALGNPIASTVVTPRPACASAYRSTTLPSSVSKVKRMPTAPAPRSNRRLRTFRRRDVVCGCEVLCERVARTLGRSSPSSHRERHLRRLFRFESAHLVREREERRAANRPAVRAERPPESDPRRRRARVLARVARDPGWKVVGPEGDRSEVRRSRRSHGLLGCIAVGRGCVLGDRNRIAVGSAVDGDLDARVQGADESLGEVSPVLPVDADDHGGADDPAAPEADERPECLIVAEPDGLPHAVCLVCRLDREGPDSAEVNARLRRPVLARSRESETGPAMTRRRPSRSRTARRTSGRPAGRRPSGVLPPLHRRRRAGSR
jgi:hypothetical protein